MKKMTIIGLLLFVATCYAQDKYSELDEDLNNNKLWYTYPAKYWNSQALHLGNGYLGASFFGGIEEEVLALSESSMWAGMPANGNWEKAGVNPNAKESLPLIRKKILNGQVQKADSLILNNFFGSDEYFGYFTSIGNLKIKFQNHNAEVTNYVRSLDLLNSIGSVHYDMNNINYKREYFCSYPDRVLAMKFSANKKGSISFNIGLDIIQESSQVRISGNNYHMRGYIDDNQRPFDVLINVKNNGGVIGQTGNQLTVRKANSVELYLTIATNYKMEYPSYTGNDPKETVNHILKKIELNNYDQLKSRHIKDYKMLFNRVKFSLKGDINIEKLPTNERFKNLTSGQLDPGYKVLAFNLGRYMIISSSRPNTLPANLQGVWNIFNIAPWTGNYQSNINLQEIYWSCGPTDLLECQQSYINWIENLAISGREVAKKVYGSNGWVSHTTGNIWGHAAPYGGLSWGLFPAGAAWHCQHLWDHFSFSQDTLYLKNQAYPLMRDASIFWLENLIPFKGYLISAPTVSAEHGASMTKEGLNPSLQNFRSKDYNYNILGAYQDIQMVWELFTNTSKAAFILGYTSFGDSLLKTRDNLLPLKIGKYGQLQEWYEDIDNPNDHHRHIAHLYSVYPGERISPLITPKLAIAAKKTLDMRGDGRFPGYGASGGNWARAYRMWLWTRLFDGNRANKIMTEMLTEQGFENGLTFQHAGSNPPTRSDVYMEGNLACNFQLDGTAALPGCIAEMLVQSQLNEINLLPALPDEFKTGRIDGLRARGGYKINMEWKDGKLLWANIFTKKNSPTPIIRLENEIINIQNIKTIKFITQE